MDKNVLFQRKNVNHNMFIDPIRAKEYNWVVSLLWKFFQTEKFDKVPVQHRLSILAACEDPTTMTMFNYAGNTWPLPQTGQMQLEYELLSDVATLADVNQMINSCFWCESTSYRQESDPIPGRHNLIFPMVEFEMPGDMDTLRNFLKKMLAFLNISHDVPSLDYEEACRQYDTKELGAQHEARIKEDYGFAVMLEHFPIRTSPFWNMKLSLDGTIAHKIDVIIDGIETVGSAERSSNPDQMRNQFLTISDGMYAKTLFASFGKERVMNELEEFLALPFVPRCGGGIGVTRLISAMKHKGLMPDF